MSKDNSAPPSNTGDNEIIADHTSLEVQKKREIGGNTGNYTYGQILKSSALIGGSTLINIVIRMLRTKAMALIVGPSGVGLMGMYESIIELTQSIVGMGVNSSGVRQIAEAAGSDDTGRIARTAQVLQRTSVFLALLGAVFIFGFSDQLAQFTFGNAQHANGVALLALAIFFNLLAAGQGALIQGMRRVSDLAKMSILGTFFGAAISIPMVYFLHEEGIALSIILVSAIGLLSSWWYKRKIGIPPAPMLASQVGQEQAALLKLGFAFMASGLMMSGATYLVRTFITRNAGIDAAGLYQSAWALGGLYIGIILQAMGTDFYPRLTAIVHDNGEANRVVNEQAHVSLLLAGPGIIATLTFAPLVIAIFYTAKFEGAIELLRWLCLGMALRVISWPMGFIIVAKNAQKLFFFSELAWTFVYLGLAWFCINSFGLNGAGLAFFGSYVFHVVMIYFIVRQLSGFRWTAANLKACIIFLALIAIVFTGFFILPTYLAIGIGLLATLGGSIYSIQVLVNFVPPDRMPRALKRLLVWFRFLEDGEGLNQAKANGTVLRKRNVQWLLLIGFFVLGAAYLCELWFENPQDLRALFQLMLEKISKLALKSN